MSTSVATGRPSARVEGPDYAIRVNRVPAAPDRLSDETDQSYVSDTRSRTAAQPRSEEMRMRNHSRRAALSAGVALLTAVVAVALSGAAPASSAGGGSFVYTVHPLSKYFSASTPAAFPTPSQCVAHYGIACYTPAEIRKAYDIPAGSTGAGTSIAIVDAYGSPTIESDLATFSAAFGLPYDASTLNVYYPGGKPATLTAHAAVPLNWAGETTLDVEWAHAIAPEATINLVVAASPSGDVLNNAVQYAVAHNLGDVLSMSYGVDEAYIKGKNANNAQVNQATQIFSSAVAKGMAVFASSGDGGASDGFPVANAGYPASDPNVISVGGTNLFTTDNGTYVNETVWNDGDPAQCPFGCTDGPFGATGGAPSKLFAASSFQGAVSGLTARTTSDVAYNASVYTSVLVYAGFYPNPADNGFYFYGGTSSGSPQWAAIGALAKAAGASLSGLDAKLYGVAASHPAAFHDVTVGSNNFNGPGYSAGVGYDIPTGLGSPDVAKLVAALQ
jgi:subtilase family serine protease